MGSFFIIIIIIIMIIIIIIIFGAESWGRISIRRKKSYG